jgi:hypothetical protein
MENCILRPSNRWEKMEKLYLKLTLVGENGKQFTVYGSQFTVYASKSPNAVFNPRFSGLNRLVGKNVSHVAKLNT